MILSEEDIQRIREKALQKWRINGRAVSRPGPTKAAVDLEARIRELSGQWEAEAVASAERAAARLRARKPAGQAPTSDGAAIQPEAQKRA